MLILRSVIFNLLFYLNLLGLLVAALPTLLMPRAAILSVARLWARMNSWLLRAICGITAEFRGLEKIPPGPLIVACKHQSLWEAFALVPLFADPAYIMKRELMWIPFFGWYTWKAGMIAVDRSKGSQALPEMNACVRRELARNRQVIIFPEGTRRSPGAEPRYKQGVAHLYVEQGSLACLLRSIPDCSGRADPCGAAPAPFGSRCSIRSRQGSTRRFFSSVCRPQWKTRPRVC